MGWVIGVCVVLAVVAVVVWPYFRPTPKPRAAPVHITPAPDTPPTASNAFSHATQPARRVVVRAGGMNGNTAPPPKPLSAAGPVEEATLAPVAVANNTVRVAERRAALAQEEAALEELDFEHGLGAISDDDYTELRERTTARIADLQAQMADPEHDL